LSEDVRTACPVSVPILASKQPVLFAGVNIHTSLEPPDRQPQSFWPYETVLDAAISS